MVNEVALVLLFAMFGWRVAAIYAGTGVLIAIVAGWTIGRLKMERYVEPWVYATQFGEAAAAEVKISWPERIRMATESVRDIVGKVWPYVLVGIAVGAGMHGYVPENFMASNAAGIIPIVQVLLAKGAALGTVLAFMMSVIGLSLPETIILRKVLRPQLIAVFVGVVAVGILVVGYVFNFIM
jgi:hypothetical protein